MITDCFGQDGEENGIAAILGVDPRRTLFKMADFTAEELRILRSSKLEKLDENFTMRLCRLVSETAYQILKREAGISHAYTTGFVGHGHYLGGLTIFSTQDIAAFSETIEIIVNQAALSIKRIMSEIELKASEERYKSIFDQSPLGITLSDAHSGQINQKNIG